MSGPEPTPVRVWAHSGGRGEEEPRAVELDGERCEVAEILERSREPAGHRFRVRAAGRSLTLLVRADDLSWWRVG